MRDIFQIGILMKTDFIRVRVEPELKIQVHQIFNKFGMTPTQVITKKLLMAFKIDPPKLAVL